MNNYQNRLVVNTKQDNDDDNDIELEIKKHNIKVYSGILNQYIENFRLRPVAYVVSDQLVGDIEIYESSRAWWKKDKTKVYRLIEGLKTGHTIKRAREYAGINEVHWKHFLKIHPHFREMRKRFEAIQVFRATNTLNQNMDDPKVAMFILKHKDPQFKTKPTLYDINPNEDDILPEDYDHEELVESFMEAGDDYLEELFTTKPELRKKYEAYKKEHPEDEGVY